MLSYFRLQTVPGVELGFFLPLFWRPPSSNPTCSAFSLPHFIRDIFKIFLFPSSPFSRLEREERRGVFCGGRGGFKLRSKIRVSCSVPESRTSETFTCAALARRHVEIDLLRVFSPASPLTVSHSLPQWDYAFREPVIITDCNFVRGADHRFSSRRGGREG